MRKNVYRRGRRFALSGFGCRERGRESCRPAGCGAGERAGTQSDWAFIPVGAGIRGVRAEERFRAGAICGAGQKEINVRKYLLTAREI